MAPSGSSTCNSSNGNAVASSCIFYDVTAGDMVAPCTNYPNTTNYYSCYRPSGTYGVMSTNNNAYAPAFATGTGWDFATGIGTVNVYNLVTNWASSGGGNASLTVSVTGSGTVASNPSGISCPSTCSHTFTGGSQVTLTPTPASGWAFSSWGGACSGSGGCTVTMNAAESVTATFVQDCDVVGERHRQRHGDELAAGDQLPVDLQRQLRPGTQVTLTATPANGWRLQRLGRRLQRHRQLRVTMNAAQSRHRDFRAIPIHASMSASTGNGTVTQLADRDQLPVGVHVNFQQRHAGDADRHADPAADLHRLGRRLQWQWQLHGDHELDRKRTGDVLAIGRPGGPSRTFVSATSGNDANPCTRMSPCLTFAAALAQTTAGGEIDVLDPGDFGPVTITKAVSIYSDAFGAAGLMPSPGTSGIVVSAGASDTVNLRGLIFDGVNASGTSGVVFLSGARLNISKCVFQGFTTSGMTFSPGAGSATTTRLDVQDTTIVNNATGLLIQPTGGIAANVTLRWLRIDNNTGEGLRVDGTGGSGAINAALADSTASFNASNGIDAVSGPGNATVDIMRVVAAANGSAGIQSNQSSGGTASVTVGNSVLYANAIGIQATGGAGLLTYGNNQVTGNASNGSFTGTASFH